MNGTYMKVCTLILSLVCLLALIIHDRAKNCDSLVANGDNILRPGRQLVSHLIFQ